MNSIQALYTEYERKNVVHHDLYREEAPPVVRHVGKVSPRGYISYFDLNGHDADAIIQREIDFYTAIGQTFEWKTYDFDQPADIRERLVAQGFELGEIEALLVLDLENLPEKLTRPFPHDIRRITDPPTASAILNTVQNLVFEEERDNWINENIKRSLAHHPGTIDFYAAYDGEQPVSAAWMFYNAGSPFAGLFGGATLEEYRGQGYYSALVAQRARTARQRGIRYLTVDASPMSRPILERIGFQLLGFTWECTFSVASD